MVLTHFFLSESDSALYLRFIIQPINVPAVKPTTNVVATVSTRCRCMRCVVSLRSSSAASPPRFATRLTTPTPSCMASATALVAREACPADSVMYSAVLPTTVSDMVPSIVGFRALTYDAFTSSSLKTEEGWPFGTIFVRRLAGLRRRFEPFVDALSWGLGVTVHCCSVIIMQNNIEERTVNVQIVSNVIVDKAKLPESVHEEADSRTSRSHHLGQSLLTQSGDRHF